MRTPKRSSALSARAQAKPETVTKMPTTARISTSHLEFHDAPQPNDSNCCHGDRTVEQDLAQRRVKERRKIARVHDVDEEPDRDGEDGDDDRPDASLSGEGVRLTAQTAAGVHGLGDDVE